ncbi:DUF721 domain-containing protein [Flavobacteriales bacterium]|jgi:hypothetical protein|nr:DUF721 domain-containing protein [Flavobacteriales bacterium]
MARKAQNEEMAAILERMLKQYGLTVGLDKVNVKDIYKSVVGDYIFNQTKSIQLRKKVLFIRFDIPAIRQEISMAKSTLVKSINEKAKKELIDEIIIH